MSMIYAMSAIYHTIATKMRLGAIWKYAISVFFQKMTHNLNELAISAEEEPSGFGGVNISDHSKEGSIIQKR